MKKFIPAVLMVYALASSHLAMAADSTSNICKSADIWTKIIDQVCWSCFTEGFSLVGIGNKPEGASGNNPLCTCTDNLGVPFAGTKLSYFAPLRLIETVKLPWCSPSLGGITLQDDYAGMGKVTKKNREGFWHTHYFAFPLMEMLEVMYIDCHQDGYVDLDLMYITEVDPTWNNDILALMLSPEAILFATPLAQPWCASDCSLVSADKAPESTFGCAGCDGHLYPFTGRVRGQSDTVAQTSLVAQRMISSLHRKGLSKKTMGEDSVCKSQYAAFTPRSQYKFSMIYPMAEADDTNPNQGCCHPLGQSTNLWCLPVGGRMRPGQEDAVYMLWQYKECCLTLGS
ncbi:TraU family protein [Shewanella algae]|uniref:TraU family protein n=1 Tax=Shewanella TaxID=22 RepID=UPI000F428203|nr:MULTISPECIES: TraU family protein [Shewanella]AYV11549.1 plasmid transfer protein [Shewanella algae]MBO2656111.1 TraU family protein [Shewanella algae]